MTENTETISIPEIKRQINNLSPENRLKLLEELGAEIDVRKEWVNFWNEE